MLRKGLIFVLSAILCMSYFTLSAYAKNRTNEKITGQQAPLTHAIAKELENQTIKKKPKPIEIKDKINIKNKKNIGNFNNKLKTNTPIKAKRTEGTQTEMLKSKSTKKVVPSNSQAPQNKTKSTEKKPIKENKKLAKTPKKEDLKSKKTSIKRQEIKPSKNIPKEKNISKPNQKDTRNNKNAKKALTKSESKPQSVTKKKTTPPIWKKINETTWYEKNGWLGVTYVFFKNNLGQYRCIRQELGSGVKVTNRAFISCKVTAPNEIMIGDSVYKLKGRKLISEDKILTFHSEKPLIYNIYEVIDIRKAKDPDFDAANISSRHSNGE